jgi:hypothetical protein
LDAFGHIVSSFFPVLQIEPRDSHMLQKCSTIWTIPLAFSIIFIVFWCAWRKMARTKFPNNGNTRWDALSSVQSSSFISTLWPTMLSGFLKRERAYTTWWLRSDPAVALTLEPFLYHTYNVKLIVNPEF